MGGKCCTDRKTLADSAAQEQQKHRSISISYHSKGADADRFDKAFQSNDLNTFVQLLQSDQPIASFKQKLHPWAMDPQTIGALAATQLAILASAAEKDDSQPNLKLQIHEAGAVKPLVEFLRSNTKDRVQTAVVALSFLTADCPEIAIAAYEAGAMGPLLMQVASDMAGMRAAAATTLRNICMESDKYRAEFVRLGGIKGLVEQLSSIPDPALNHADVQLEAVLNLQDFIETKDGAVIDAYALEAMEAGVEAKLQSLTQVDDEEVSNSAEELLTCLSKVRMKT